MDNENDSYPTFEFDSKSRVNFREGTWHYVVKLHVLGPDDIFEKKSKLFNTKQDATEHMIAHYTATLNELIAQF